MLLAKSHEKELSHCMASGIRFCDNASTTILTMKFKPRARSRPKTPIKSDVKREGPAPRAADTIRLAVVKAAPRNSGGLTAALIIS